MTKKRGMTQKTVSKKADFIFVYAFESLFKPYFVVFCQVAYDDTQNFIWVFSRQIGVDFGVVFTRISDKDKFALWV
jgi:hypothetical protein